MINPIQLDVTAIDFHVYGDEVVLRLVCDDGSAYEVAMLASQGYAIGCNIADRSEDILRRRPVLA